MKALISPIEPVNNSDGTTGYRVAQVEEITFDVAEPLYWLDCDANVIADIYYFDTTSNNILKKPVIAHTNVSGTQPISTGTQAF